MNNISIERSNYRGNKVVQQANRTRDEDLLKKSTGKLDVYYMNRGTARADASLVPPIRQTASIFKQPVTLHRNHDSKVKSDLKHGPQEKPRQLFWEKRLENMHACDDDGTPFPGIVLNSSLKPVGPNVSETTLLQSIATSLHMGTHSVTGQTASKTALASNPGVFINVDQPLMYSCSIGEEDIRRQEDRVNLVRNKLQEALKA